MSKSYRNDVALSCVQRLFEQRPPQNPEDVKVLVRSAFEVADEFVRVMDSGVEGEPEESVIKHFEEIKAVLESYKSKTIMGYFMTADTNAAVNRMNALIEWIDRRISNLKNK